MPSASSGTRSWTAQGRSRCWKPLATLEAIGAGVAQRLGCGDPATAPACLRALPVEALLAATGPDGQPVFWSPAIGTRVLPRHPAEALRSGRFNRVPVLAGTTRDEGAFFAATFPPLTVRDYEGLVRFAFGDHAGEVLDRYPAAAFRSPRQAWGAIVTDRGFACPNLRSGAWLARRTPTYAYEFADRAAPLIFTFPAPVEFPLGAYHASEVPYVHGLAGTDLPFTPEQRRLSDQMIRAWSRFAATGGPNGPALPPWPRFRAGAPVPYVQALAPGPAGIRGVDLSAEHHCALWDTIDQR